MDTAPLRRVPRHRGRSFRPHVWRTVELNPAGWAAVALLGLVGAAAGHALARAVGRFGAAGAPLGALTVFTALLVGDRRRWGRMETGYSWTEDAAAIERAAAALRRDGVDVHVDTDPDGASRLRYRNRDAARVRRGLHGAGFPAPPAW